MRTAVVLPDPFGSKEADDLPRTRRHREHPHRGNAVVALGQVDHIEHGLPSAKCVFYGLTPAGKKWVLLGVRPATPASPGLTPRVLAARGLLRRAARITPDALT